MIKQLILKSIKLYQKFISPSLGVNCRFYPSCSRYLYRVIEGRGLVKGLWQGMKRTGRCHPWSCGGIDLP